MFRHKIDWCERCQSYHSKNPEAVAKLHAFSDKADELIAMGDMMALTVLSMETMEPIGESK